MKAKAAPCNHPKIPMRPASPNAVVTCPDCGGWVACRPELDKTKAQVEAQGELDKKIREATVAMAKGLAPDVFGKAKKKRRQSRADRWAEATAECRTALGGLEKAGDVWDTALRGLQDVWQEYSDWNDSLPENMSGSATSDKLEAVASIDLESAEVDLDAQKSVVEEAEGVDLPLGWGRD